MNEHTPVTDEKLNECSRRDYLWRHGLTERQHAENEAWLAAHPINRGET